MTSGLKVIIRTSGEITLKFLEYWIAFDDNNLEGKVIDILGKIDVKVTSDEIEACHRLPPSKNNPIKRTILRFVNRKICETCIISKKKLSNVNLADLELPFGTKIFISENLNNHFRNLAFHCRRLKRENLIAKFKYQNEAFHVNILNDSRQKYKVNHKNDLVKVISWFFLMMKI